MRISLKVVHRGVGEVRVMHAKMAGFLVPSAMFWLVLASRNLATSTRWRVVVARGTGQ